MSKKIKVWLLVLVVICCFLVYAESETKIISGSMKAYKKAMTPVGITYEYGFDSKTAFGRGGKGFLSATKDGAVYYNYKGAALWRETFTMNEPYIIKAGNVFAILEPLGRRVYVCNEQGILYSVATDSPIISGGINQMGRMILILQKNDGTYRMPQYDETGGNTMEGISEIDGVFPVCADISEDGLTSAVSYLDIRGTSIVSRTLYSYTKEGAEKAGIASDTPFKAIEQTGSVISKIHFFENGNLVISADDEILVTTREGEEVVRLRPQNRIMATSFSERGLALITGEPLPNSETPETQGTAMWYTSDGKPAGKFSEEEIGGITIYDDLLLLKSEHNYYCLEQNGRTLWTIGAGKDIVNVMPVDEKKALVARVNYAELYALKNQRV